MSLYRVPEAFKDRLAQEFGDRIRIRWSDKMDEWQVEQKVRRGLVGRPITEDRYSDDVIRFNDDYVWIMSFKNGTKFPCPKCGLDLKAKTRENVMAQCQHCRLKGYEYRWEGSHWPFDETLIQHLKELEANIDTTGQKVNKARVMLQKQMERESMAETLAGFEDNFNKLAGIPSVGYTGKEFKG